MQRSRSSFLAVCVPLLLATGCPQPPGNSGGSRGGRSLRTRTEVVLPREGVRHSVKRGETLRSICLAYGKSVDAIRKVNGLSSAQVVRPGQWLFIPGAESVIESSVPATGGAGEVLPLVKPYRGPRAAKMIWPATGAVVSKYRGWLHGAPSDGIEISAPLGAAVWAAQDGKVCFRHDDFPGLGRIVIVRHRSGLRTLYGHLHESFVRIGDSVRQGDVVGRAGTTGRAAKPQVHFRVYQGRSPVDPLPYLKN